MDLFRVEKALFSPLVGGDGEFRRATYGDKEEVMSEKFYVGIDPGESGAWAIVTRAYYNAGLYDDRKRFVDFVKCQAPTKFVACLEKVHAMPRQGVTSMFTFGESFGVWRGILESLEIPYHLITPQKWQKGTLDYLPSGRELVKKAAVDFVRRLYPDSDKMLSVKKNWGIADAICLARYAQKLEGEYGKER